MVRLLNCFLIAIVQYHLSHITIKQYNHSTISYPPILTVTHPTAAIAPQMQASVVRKAGLPPIITVALPIGKMEDVMWPVLGGITHTWLSVATAAGCPPIITVGAPGPTIVPP